MASLTLRAIALNAMRNAFSSFQDMASHLDRWAGSSLSGRRRGQMR